MNKKIKKIALSLSVILIISMSFTGCGSGSSTDDTLKGVAIDGYLDGALVSMNGYNTTTYSNGYWELPIEAYIQNGVNIVEIMGGIDISTGENYEGVLILSLKSIAKRIYWVVNPLSSLIPARLRDGVTQEEAEEKIAQQLGITVETFNFDPIAVLESGTVEEKKEAAIALRQSLTIQKIAEIFSKSVGGENGVFMAVINSMSERLFFGKSFDTVVRDMDGIAQDVEAQLLEMGFDETAGMKLLAASDAAQAISTMITRFDPSVFENTDNIHKTLKSKSKAIEVITQQLEVEMAKVALMTPQELQGFDYKEIVNGFMMLGGVDGIEAIMIEAQESMGLGEDEEFDTSMFGDSFFGEGSTILQEQAKVYDETVALFEASGMEADDVKMIFDVYLGTGKALVDIAADMGRL